MPKVSVIVPVYNVKKYLPRCVDSILAQTFTDFELILVNDGSKDNSGAICDEYAAKDSRIIVIHKENGGLSDARNAGINAAQGEWISFVDSDDYVDNLYLSLLFEYSNNDLTICDINNISENSNINNHVCMNVNIKHTEFYDFTTNIAFLQFLKNGLFNPSWNKLYKRNLIVENNLRFKNIEIAEDIEFNLQYLKYCRKINYISARLYNYIHHSGSLTSKVSEEMYKNYLKIHTSLLDFFDPILHKYVDQFIYHQYLSISLRFIKQNNFEVVKKNINQKLIKQSIMHYKASCIGEWILYILFRYKCVKLIKLLFVK